MPNDFGFPVGTRVILVKDDPYNYVGINQTGTVCHVIDDDFFGDGCNIGVSWDEASSRLHNCNGHCKAGHGRYLPHTHLEHVCFDLGEIKNAETAVDILFGTI